MFQEDFVGGPIRQRIHPASPRVEKKQRNAQNQKQDALSNLKKRDQSEIANTTGALQNSELCAGLFTVHFLAETNSFRNDRPFPAANFQLVTVRILEEKCIVAGTELEQISGPSSALGPPALRTNFASRSTSFRVSAQNAIRVRFGL